MHDINHLVGGGEAAALVALADDGTPTTTSLVIAEGVGREHKPIVRLIREHLGDFEDFGPVGFENSPVATSGNAPDTYQTVAVRPDGQVVPTATTYVLPTGVEFLRRKLAGQDVAEQPVTVAALPLAEAK